MLTLTDQTYLEIIEDINKNGEEHFDRTGVGTHRVFGRMYKFPAEEFPALTLKPVAFRYTVAELLWMLSGSTNINDLAKLCKPVVKWWQPWADKNGYMGRIYGAQYRRLKSDRIIKIKPVVYKQETYEAPYFDKEVIKYSELDKENLIGKTLSSLNYGDFIVTGCVKNKKLKYSIQFLNTGFVKHNISKSSLLKGQVRDSYYPSVYGVGFMGNKSINKDSSDLEKDLFKVWKNMIRRCYYPKAKDYKNYGLKGVSVSDRWLCFSIFYEEVQLIRGWHNKQDHPDLYQLDKDYLGSNIYSKQTCVWSDAKINMSNNNRPFTSKYLGQKERTHLTIEQCARDLNLNPSSIYKVLSSNYAENNLHGFTFKYIDTENWLYRYELNHDQLLNTISNIKINPNSRRHIINLWNPREVHEMSLPCCHGNITTFCVINNKLHMSTLQRSCDLSLGLPHNWISYKILQMIIAYACGLELGDMTYFINDLHIYNNHMNKMLTLPRKSFSNPSIKINFKKDIDTYELSDFELLNYKSGPKVKLEMAV